MSARMAWLAVALAAAQGAFAQSDGTVRSKEATEPYRVVTRGDESRGRVDRVLTSIAWVPDIEAAFDRARQEGKPVFWLQLVGNLDGDV